MDFGPHFSPHLVTSLHITHSLIPSIARVIFYWHCVLCVAVLPQRKENRANVPYCSLYAIGGWALDPYYSSVVSIAPSTSSISNHLPPRRAWTCAPCPGSPRPPSPPPGGGRASLCSTDRWVAARKADRRCTPRYTVPEGMTRGTRPSTWWRGSAHSPTGSFKVHPIS